MDFTYGRYSLFSQIEATTPAIRRALGQYVIDFTVSFTPDQLPGGHPGAFIVDDLHVDVCFGQDRREVGLARPAPNGPSFIALRTPPASFSINLAFRLYLSPSALEAMEESRKGGDAVFHLKILGNVKGYATRQTGQHISPDAPWRENLLLNGAPLGVYQPERGFRDFQLPISQSDWCRLLEKAGYQSSILFEIPVAETGHLGAGLKHLREAQAAFADGRYDGAVAQCRHALDAIGSVDCPWEMTKDREARESMTVGDRFRLGWCAIRHITHAPHHPGEAEREFTRPKAQYVLGATALALALAGKEHGLVVASTTARADGATPTS